MDKCKKHTRQVGITLLFGNTLVSVAINTRPFRWFVVRELITRNNKEFLECGTPLRDPLPPGVISMGRREARAAAERAAFRAQAARHMRGERWPGKRIGSRKTPQDF